MKPAHHVSVQMPGHLTSNPLQDHQRYLITFTDKLPADLN